MVKRVDAFAIAVSGNDASRNWLIVENRFHENDKGIRIAAYQDHGTRDLSPARPPSPRPHSILVRRNSFRGGCIGVELKRVERTALEDNQFRDVRQSEIVESHHGG